MNNCGGVRLLVAVALAGCCGCFGWKAEVSDAVRYVDEFELSATSCGMGKRTFACKSVDGHALKMSGRTYAHGFGTHPEGAVAFTANGKVAAFDALVGIDDDAKNAGSGKSYGQPAACFNVWADGLIVWSSGDLRLGQKPREVHVDLAGAKEIILETKSGRAYTAFDAANADWADARFTLGAGAELELVDDPAAHEQLGILTPPEKPEPQFNGADIWGVRPGHPVLYRVPVSGVRPMAFTAKDLPAGVTLDPAKGILAVVAPLKKGDYDITVTAENAKGRASRVIRLAVGDTIALTPPMGWNSWNVWCHRLTAEHVMASARALQDSGLGDHGWAYVNLDDWWEMNNSGIETVETRRKDLGREDVIGPARDADGRIIPNRSFPDMRKLTDYIHGFGFKAGIYSSPGPLTCGKCEGSYQHELQDAESWADWGFDYIKYDWCTYSEIFEKEHGFDPYRDLKSMYLSRNPGLEKPYALMGECLRKQKRDIVFSFGQCGMGKVEEWGDAAGGNCWRICADLKDGWTWMEDALEGPLGGDYWRYNKPGWWADPDMLVVGRQYSYGSDHPTYLTPNEQYTHVSLWAMVGAPLLIGCDLTKLDAFTRNLLANDAVIAISQDRLGKTARRIRHVDSESVWVRPLADGAKAVALVNRYPIAREIRVSFVELGLGDGEHWVKDVWRQACEGKHSGEYVVTVPPHATKLVYVRSVGCAKCE